MHKFLLRAFFAYWDTSSAIRRTPTRTHLSRQRSGCVDVAKAWSSKTQVTNSHLTFHEVRLVLVESGKWRQRGRGSSKIISDYLVCAYQWKQWRASHRKECLSTLPPRACAKAVTFIYYRIYVQDSPGSLLFRTWSACNHPRTLSGVWRPLPTTKLCQSVVGYGVIEIWEVPPARNIFIFSGEYDLCAR